ncbi:MAG: winged helix DNA-binding domain-containing protein [Myxococcota bacterium]
MKAVLEARLARQALLEPLPRPEDVVERLAAVQAQDYLGALWAVGQRTQGATEATIDRAVREARILRTHVLRPTWHLVVPADLRWMLSLSRERVHRQAAPQHKKEGLDAAAFRKAERRLEAAFKDADALTREELGAALAHGGLELSGPALGHVMMHAELEALVINGPRRGKQHTYRLLDRVVPPSPVPPREALLPRIAERFLLGHAPATRRDLAWWAGLTQGEAQAGLDALGATLTEETIAGETYYALKRTPLAAGPSPSLSLLPNYDEYVVAYADRSGFIDPTVRGLGPADMVIARHVLAIEGRVIGAWRRTLTAKSVRLELELGAPLSARAQKALEKKAQAYADFLGKSLELSGLGSPGAKPPRPRAAPRRDRGGS